MPGPITITEGGYAEQREGETLVYQFNWDTLNLASGVELIDAGTFEVSPDGLTLDNEALVTGNRKTNFRISGGRPDKKYTITHVVTTNETPAQIKRAWFALKIVSP
jgi:hypothetical protein